MAVTPTHHSARGPSGAEGAARVAVFRGLRGIGDMLVAVPALRALRRGLPDARIALITAEPVLAERFGGIIDDVVPFPGWPGLPEAGSPAGGKHLEAWRSPDVAVQMHGDGTRSNAFCSALEPLMLVGFGPCVSQRGCAVVTAPYPLREPEVGRCLDVAIRAVRAFGGEAPDVDRTLDFPLTDRDRAEAASLMPSGPYGTRRYFVLHPGSHLPDRRWPAERFAAVGRSLAETGPVLVTGSDSEAALAAEVALLVGPGARSVAGRLTVGGLAALIAASSGVVTNDTGISHVADAVGAPSVVVFMASDPHRWAPLDATRHAAVVRQAGEGEPAAVTPEGVRLAVPDVEAVLRGAARVGLLS